jgi:GMP synthase (glutamine-hydrolysing)
MDPTLIVKTGTAIESLAASGDFEDWICRGMDIDRGSIEVVNVFDGEPLPSPDRFAGIVVTGSPAMVTHRDPWSESTAAWLGDAIAAGNPTLGICYGHQLIAHALGGEVGENPRGREIGTVDVTLEPTAQGDALLTGFSGRLRIHMSHSESVLQLPDDATRLGSTRQDPNAAFSIGSAWGIQFHPEFDADIMQGYVTARRAALEAEGIDPEERLASIAECPDGPSVLQRFHALLQRPI